MAESRRTSKESMLLFAERAEADRKVGHLPQTPPVEIFDHPDLLERAWGWDRIVPNQFQYDWSDYKKYLQEYYSRNAPTALARQMKAKGVADDHNLVDDGNGLEAYADSCIEMEGELMTLLKHCPHIFTVDEGNLSNKITSCAHQIKNFKCCEFPAAATALKCVKMEADLLCEVIITRVATSGTVDTISKIRQCALSFMTYKGPEHVAAAAIMMGAMKEANMMYELLRSGKHKEERSAYLWSYTIRKWTLESLSGLCSEYCDVEQYTRDNTAGKFESEGSGGHNSFEKTIMQEIRTRNEKTEQELLNEEGNLNKRSEQQLTKEDATKEDKRSEQQLTKEDATNEDNRTAQWKRGKKLLELLRMRRSRDHHKASQGTKGFAGCFRGSNQEALMGAASS